MTPEQQESVRRNHTRSRLICALDLPSAREALRLVDLLRDEVGMFKVGKQLFGAAGPDIGGRLPDRGGKVFLDLKFHDIPRTVAKAAIEAARLGVAMLDLHALGGPEMLRQTVSEVTTVGGHERLAVPRILAVTVLTSLTGGDLETGGVWGDL